MSLIPPQASPPQASPLGSAKNPIIIDHSETHEGKKRARDESTPEEPESPTKRSRAGSEPREEDATTDDVMVAHAYSRIKRLCPEIRMQQIAETTSYDFEEYYDAAGIALEKIVKRLLVLDLLYTDVKNGNAFYLPTSVGKDNKVDIRDPNFQVFYYDGSWWFHFDYDFEGKHIHKVKRAQLRLAVDYKNEPVVIIDATYDVKW